MRKKLHPFKRPNYRQQTRCFKNIIIIQFVIMKNNAELIGLSLISKHSLCCKEDKNSTIN
nr:MAG TPA: hypothetical protein [Caudoviricetes sp.]